MIQMAIIISNLSCVSQGSNLLELRVEGLEALAGVSRCWLCVSDSAETCHACYSAVREASLPVLFSDA